MLVESGVAIVATPNCLITDGGRAGAGTGPHAGPGAHDRPRGRRRQTSIYHGGDRAGRAS